MLPHEISDTELLNWIRRQSKWRWKVMGPPGKMVLAYSHLDDPNWGSPDLRSALREAWLKAHEAIK